MKLHDVLMKKAQNKELGHFYVLEGTGESQETQKLLEDFVHHFIRDYYQKIEGHKQSMENLMDHPDVLVLGNLTQTEDPTDSPFTVSESDTVSRFFEFKAVQSKRKFAVITEAHRINTIVANKWLKLLEEPYGDSTIFLINGRRQKLLDTIHSRAIHLRIPLPRTDLSTEEWDEFLTTTKSLSLSQFLEKFQKAERDLAFWVNELILWESQQTDDPAPKQALEEWLKNYREMEVFHQPSATKWSLFYSYLHERVLPRASH